MNGGARDQDADLDLERLGGFAAVVLAHAETWIGDGLGHDVALALVQNALPLTEDAPALPYLQRRSHARVLTALLLLIDDPVAGSVATGLVELLERATRQAETLAS